MYLLDLLYNLQRAIYDSLSTQLIGFAQTRDWAALGAMFPDWASGRNAALAVARAALSESDFEDAWTKGRHLTPNEAIDETFFACRLEHAIGLRRNWLRIDEVTELPLALPDPPALTQVARINPPASASRSRGRCDRGP